MQDSTPRRLTRSRDRRLGGVCDGIGEYFDIDPTLVRVLWVVLALVTAGGGAVLIYFVLWLVMPSADSPPRPRPAEGSARGRADGTLVLGVVLLIVGFLLLLQRMPVFWWFGWGIMRFSWPLALIAAGALIVFAARRR